jgi:sulfatase modifying factor 1
MARHALFVLFIAASTGCTSEPSTDAESDTDGAAESGTAGETGSDEPEPGMLEIPAGMVWRGCIDGDLDCADAEQPGRWIEVSAFHIDQFEVTVAEYSACVAAAECNPTSTEPECNSQHDDRTDHPLNCATYFNARDYCSWRGKRLPTEAEWERAARGDQLSLYPWGAAAPSCTLAVIADGDANGCGTGTTAPVGSKPEGDSFFGVSDMTGNVAEWTSDWYSQTYYADSPATDPQGPDDGTTRCLRGGSFTETSDNTAHRISKRFATPPSAFYEMSGFRCARTP